MATARVTGYVGYDHQVKTMLSSYTGGTLTISTFNTFATIRAQIDNNKPLYSDWQGIELAHAMVIRGYYINSADVGPFAERMTLMDPNEDTYQTLTIGFPYVTSEDTYTWYSSVY